MTIEPIKLNTPSHLEDHCSFNGLDIVKITNLKTSTVIGICEDELFEPQPLIITIDMGILRPTACDSDDIRQTVEYDCVRKTVIKFATNNKYKLLESFGEQLSRILLDKYKLSIIKLEIEKPAKYPDVDSVGFVMTRKASNKSLKFRHHENNIFYLLGSGIIPKK
jgi:dihydroneopterin aldolase